MKPRFDYCFSLGYRLACKEAVKYIQEHLTYKVNTTIRDWLQCMKIKQSKPNVFSCDNQW